MKYGLTNVSITCPRCHMTSHNPNDVKNRYCGNCHEFLDSASFVKEFQEQPEQTRRTIDDVWRPSKQ